MSDPNAQLARATWVILDCLTDGFEELLWELEHRLAWNAIEEPRATARAVLLGLAAGGRITFYCWPDERFRREPIAPEDGIAAVQGEIAWELGFPATTVAATKAGYDFFYGLPVPEQ
jgi:hypothetical protein